MRTWSAPIASSIVVRVSLAMIAVETDARISAGWSRYWNSAAVGTTSRYHSFGPIPWVGKRAQLGHPCWNA